jgi:citrate synthase
MMTRGSEKATAIGADEDESPTSHGGLTPGHTNADRRDAPQNLTINDIMVYLLRTQRASGKKEQEEEEEEEEERLRAQEERIRAIAKENEYKEEIKQLQSTVTVLVLDLKSLQESVPNWGSLISSSQQTRTGPLSRQELDLSADKNWRLVRKLGSSRCKP